MTKKQELPSPATLEENVADQRESMMVAPGYRVLSWRPGAAHSGEPCTEVHLMLAPIEGFRFVLRLKSARALDELVGVLLHYRREVWGGEGGAG